MTAIARNIAGNGDCKCSAGEILVVDLSFRVSPTSDELAVLTGKEFAVTLYRPGDGAELFSFAGEVGPEGDNDDQVVRFVIPGAATAAVYADESGYAAWQIAEFVGTTPQDSGLKYWIKGRFTVGGSAGSVTPASSGISTAPLTKIVIDATTQRVVISNVGAPGAPGTPGARGSDGDVPGIYNYSTSFLDRWRAARDNPAIRPIVAIIGASTITGQGAGTTANGLDDARLYSVPAYVASQLAAYGYPARQTALTGFQNSTEATFKAYDHRVSFSAGAWAAGGSPATDAAPGGGLIQQDSPNTGALTWTLDSADDMLRPAIVTKPGNGVLAISVDGGAATTYNTNAADGLLLPQIDLGNSGPHSITFARQSGGSVAIAYAETWDSAAREICVLSIAAGAYTAAQRTNDGKPWTLRNLTKALGAHVVVLSGGWSSLVLAEGTVATVKALYASMIDDMQANDIDVVLLNEWAGAVSLAPGYIWSPTDDIAIEPWRQMMRELAIEKSCVLVDLIEALGGHRDLRAAGMFTSWLAGGARLDEVHGSAAGYAASAAPISRVLAR